MAAFTRSSILPATVLPLAALGFISRFTAKTARGYARHLRTNASTGFIGATKLFGLRIPHLGGVVVRGDRRALFESGRSFSFKVIYRLRTASSNERIHGLYWGDKALWVANTARNTLLKIDPDEARVTDEVAVILDRFDRPVLYNNNHINSVSEYGGIVMFVAYRAGEQSMIGVYDGASVTGYGYPRAGVHDIFLTETGFMLCDTFGENQQESGGALITEQGPFDPSYFKQPPGFIVRGMAGTPDEFLIGHSHKGERSKRFDGHGAILVARDGKVVDRFDVQPAQVYQIITGGGECITPRPATVDAAQLHQILRAALGEPIYEAEMPSSDRCAAKNISTPALGGKRTA